MTLLLVFVYEIALRYSGNEFRSCKIDSLLGKVKLLVGDFQFCSDGHTDKMISSEFSSEPI